MLLVIEWTWVQGERAPEWQVYHSSWKNSGHEVAYRQCEDDDKIGGQKDYRLLPISIRNSLPSRERKETLLQSEIHTWRRVQLEKLQKAREDDSSHDAEEPCSEGADRQLRIVDRGHYGSDLGKWSIKRII